MQRTITTILAVLAPLSAPELRAQAAGPPIRPASQEAPADNRFDLQVTGGLSTYVDAIHASAGGMMRVHRGAWSAMGLGSLGWGDGYESLLTGLGVGRELLHRGERTLSGFAGGAYYRESGRTGISRTAPGALFGVVADVPAGPVLLSVVLSDVLGRYSGDRYVESFTFHVPRLTVAIGR